MDNVKIAKSILALAKELVADDPQNNKQKHKKQFTDIVQQKEKLNPYMEKPLQNYLAQLQGIDIPPVMMKMTVGQLVEILNRIINKNGKTNGQANGQAVNKGQ